MFHYQLPNGEPNLMVKLNNNGKIVFGRTLQEQVHSAVVDILDDPRWSNHFKKIVDFGCGNMRLFKLIRRLNNVEHILNVDVDESTLLEYKSCIDPLVSDHLQQREHPLRAEVLKGNIIHAVENLRNTDAAIALDVIQYLEPAALEKMSQNLFAFVQLKLFILTTPNREFNRLWPDLAENGFRANDHGFEWDRKEFKKWANEICMKYKNYSFAILGIGPPPPAEKKLGSAAQIVIFARKDIIARELNEPLKTDLEAEQSAAAQYKEIHAVDYSFLKEDTRATHDKIEGELMNYLRQAHKVERFYNRELDIYQIPKEPLIEYANSINADDEDILLVLKEKSLAIENEFILVTQEFIDKHFACRGEDDIYDGYSDVDDFLEFEPCHRDFGDDRMDEDELEERLSNACSIHDDNDDEEENWD